MSDDLLVFRSYRILVHVLDLLLHDVELSEPQFIQLRKGLKGTKVTLVVLQFVNEVTQLGRFLLVEQKTVVFDVGDHLESQFL